MFLFSDQEIQLITDQGIKIFLFQSLRLNLRSLLHTTPGQFIFLMSLPKLLPLKLTIGLHSVLMERMD